MFLLPLKLFFGLNLSFSDATNQPPESQLLSNVQWGRGITRLYRGNESRIADFTSAKPDIEMEAIACQDPDKMKTAVPEYRWLQGNCLRQDGQIYCHMIFCQGELFEFCPSGHWLQGSDSMSVAQWLCDNTLNSVSNLNHMLSFHSVRGANQSQHSSEETSIQTFKC